MFNRGLISDRFDLLIFPSTNVEIEKVTFCEDRGFPNRERRRKFSTLFRFFFVLSDPNQHFIYVALLYSCSAPQLDIIPTKSNQAWL